MLSHKPIQNMVCQNAVDTILLTQESLRANHWVYVSTDKKIRKEIKDVEDKQGKTFLLDVDCTNESTTEIN